MLGIVVFWWMIGVFRAGLDYPVVLAVFQIPVPLAVVASVQICDTYCLRSGGGVEAVVPGSIGGRGLC